MRESPPTTSPPPCPLPLFSFFGPQDYDMAVMLPGRGNINVCVLLFGLLMNSKNWKQTMGECLVMVRPSSRD